MHSKSYAIIKTGGKQYRVTQDDVIEVELINANVGENVEFTEVLFVNDGSNALVGLPAVAGYLVKGQLLDIASGPKIVSMKYKRRKSQYRKFGHRQHYSRVKITEIAKQG